MSECDREASISRRSWPTKDCCTMEKNKVMLYIDKVFVPRKVPVLQGQEFVYLRKRNSVNERSDPSFIVKSERE